MGFSTVGAGVILFVGLLFVTSTVLSASFEGQRSVLDAKRDDRDRERFDRFSDAEITQGSVDAQTLTLEVENTGSTSLDPTKVFLFADGVWTAPDSLDVDGRWPTSVWGPGETLTITVNVGPPAEQPDRVFVVIETGKGMLWTP